MQVLPHELALTLYYSNLQRPWFGCWCLLRLGRAFLVVAPKLWNSHLSLLFSSFASGWRIFYFILHPFGDPFLLFNILSSCFYAFVCILVVFNFVLLYVLICCHCGHCDSRKVGYKFCKVNSLAVFLVWKKEMVMEGDEVWEWRYGTLNRHASWFCLEQAMMWPEAIL